MILDRPNEINNHNKLLGGPEISACCGISGQPLYTNFFLSEGIFIFTPCPEPITLPTTPSNLQSNNTTIYNTKEGEEGTLHRIQALHRARSRQQQQYKPNK